MKFINTITVKKYFVGLILGLNVWLLINFKSKQYYNQNLKKKVLHFDIWLKRYAYFFCSRTQGWDFLSYCVFFFRFLWCAPLPLYQLSYKKGFLVKDNSEGSPDTQAWRGLPHLTSPQSCWSQALTPDYGRLMVIYGRGMRKNKSKR